MVPDSSSHAMRNEELPLHPEAIELNSEVIDKPSLTLKFGLFPGPHSREGHFKAT